MSTLLITKTSTAQSGMKKKTLSEKVTVGANTLVVLIISSICIVSVAYLVHSNKSAAKGYVLKQLKEQEKTLDQEVSYWELKVAKMKSLHALEQTAVAREMHAAAKVEFVRGDTAVAVNKKN